jgi:hypothetical protein
MYFCSICQRYFSASKKKNMKRLWSEYSCGKQSQEQIANKIGTSRKWVSQALKYPVNQTGRNIVMSPQKIVLAVDTTYFRQFGLMLFRATNLKKNLLWKNGVHSQKIKTSVFWYSKKY